jgi:hypothetical protein
MVKEVEVEFVGFHRNYFRVVIGDRYSVVILTDEQLKCTAEDIAIRLFLPVVSSLKSQYDKASNSARTSDSETSIKVGEAKNSSTV